MEESTNKHRGSAGIVTDFSPFCEGDVEPTLNKKIRVLVDCSNDYIVYIDEDLYVEWSFTHEHEQFPAGFDDIANKIGHLETLSSTQLTPAQREPLARLLAEAMARVLGDRDEKKAEAVLNKAEAYLSARGTENARTWYLQGVGVLTVVALVAAGILLWVRNYVSNPARLNLVEILIGALLGSLGALISIASRTESIHLDPVAGPKIHRFEGVVRVIVGIAGASFVAIAIKANLLLGVFYSATHPFMVLIAACIVAGASERLAPGLIKNMGKSLSSADK